MIIISLIHIFLMLRNIYVYDERIQKYIFIACLLVDSK